MIAFGWVTNLLQRGMASWKRMLDVLDAAPAIDDADVTAAGRSLAIDGAIEFRDLTFAYDPAHEPVLEDVIAADRAPARPSRSSAPPARESRRSSASSPRLHDPPPGTVFIDGVDVREIPLAALRAAIGFVPQEPFLFSDTIAENVAFGVDHVRGGDGTEGVGLERVRAAAAVARLDKDVADFRRGYRHAGRRARHHAVGRTEAADGASPARSWSTRGS